MEALCGIDALCAQARATNNLVLVLKPCAAAPPAAPPAAPALSAQALARTRAPRACVSLARQRILDTLEWENCGEESGRFRAVAQQFNEAFDNEDLETAEMEEVLLSGSYPSCSASDDDAYESSFVTDGSGSENEGESDNSEHDWWPAKKMRVRRDGADDLLSSDDAHDAPADNEAELANHTPEAVDVASHASVNHPETGPTGGGNVVAVCVLPVVFGATWMLWVDPRTVGKDAKSVFVTCVLVCGLVVAMSDWRELRDMLSSTRLAFVFLVLVEPLIKGLALSVLVVSVRTQQKRTMMLVFVSTYALASLYLGSAGLGSRVLYLCTVGMTALLCTMQFGEVVVADVHALVREDKNYMTGHRI